MKEVMIGRALKLLHFHHFKNPLDQTLYVLYDFFFTPEIQFSSSNNLAIPISSMVSAIQDILRCFSKYKRSKLLLTGDEITRMPLDLQA